ncbi:RNA-binding S4 domain-containing protein [Phascolarctobacterium faecium]|jgi:ribosome-associated protein|nr:RNA-binding S4 domain-containing protein [Phascolarctobacterium faecium]MDM8110186.1 RNA-binding S4 domain-containing protein [Phascolarctobacterium faecium]
MEKLAVQIETEYITLTNLLKYAGVVMSGGQAHELIEAGFVSLNGKTVLEKRKKIRAGDEVTVKGMAAITVSNEN